MSTEVTGGTSAVVASERGTSLPERPLYILTPSSGSWLEEFREIGEHREVLYFLVWREIKVRYKQTLLGAAWAIVQPLALTIVFAYVFSRVPGLQAYDAPYWVFLLTGLVPWMFISNAVTNSSISLTQTSNAALVTRTYFPRILIPIAAVLSCLVDLGVSAAFMAGVLLYYRVSMGWSVALLLPLLLLTILLVTGLGAWLAALNVKYRDVRHAVPFLVQLWLFATPIIYSYSSLPNWRLPLLLNPASGLVESFRAILLNGPMPWGPLGISASGAILIFWLGVRWFQRTEREFADWL